MPPFRVPTTFANHANIANSNPQRGTGRYFMITGALRGPTQNAVGLARRGISQGRLDGGGKRRAGPGQKRASVCSHSPMIRARCYAADEEKRTAIQSGTGFTSIARTPLWSERCGGTFQEIVKSASNKDGHRKCHQPRDRDARQHRKLQTCPRCHHCSRNAGRYDVGRADR